MQSHQSIHAPIPGSMAIAASPAAQLFDKNDWSWHRNPAASIRSGGTNKQTPVWKYFVYNKVENLSRYISIKKDNILFETLQMHNWRLHLYVERATYKYFGLSSQKASK